MQQIKIDFDNPGLPQHLEAMEGDAQSRFFRRRCTAPARPTRPRRV